MDNLQMYNENNRIIENIRVMNDRIKSLNSTAVLSSKENKRIIERQIKEYEVSIMYLKRQLKLAELSEVLKLKSQENERNELYSTLNLLSIKAYDAKINLMLGDKAEHEELKRKIENYELGYQFMKKYIDFKEKN